MTVLDVLNFKVKNVYRSSTLLSFEFNTLSHKINLYKNMFKTLSNTDGNYNLSILNKKTGVRTYKLFLEKKL